VEFFNARSPCCTFVVHSIGLISQMSFRVGMCWRIGLLFLLLGWQLHPTSSWISAIQTKHLSLIKVNGSPGGSSSASRPTAARHTRISTGHPGGSKVTPITGTNKKNGATAVQDTLRKTWKTGDTLVNTQSSNRAKQFRRDPWWMREDEKNNPRILSSYRPWWACEYKGVDSSWSIDDLRETARARGSSAEGTRPELLTRLQALERLYDLSDKNFRPPQFTAASGSIASCYPEVYDNIKSCPGGL
jgi:hypothetical protein